MIRGLSGFEKPGALSGVYRVFKDVHFSRTTSFSLSSVLRLILLLTLQKGSLMSTSLSTMIRLTRAALSKPSMTLKTRSNKFLVLPTIAVSFLLSRALKPIIDCVMYSHALCPTLDCGHRLGRLRMSRMSVLDVPGVARVSYPSRLVFLTHVLNARHSFSWSYCRKLHVCEPSLV